MEKKDYFVRDRLNYIRNYIKTHIPEFDYKKAYEVDLIIKKDIEKLYDKKAQNGMRQYVLNSKVDKSESRELADIILLYYALYNNNLELLKFLQEKNIIYDSMFSINLRPLNSRISEFLTPEQLIFLKSKCSLESDSFFSRVMTFSSKKIDYENRKELLDRYNLLRERLLFDELSSIERETLNRELNIICSKINITCEYKYNDDEKNRLLKQMYTLLAKNYKFAKKKDGSLYSNLVTPEVLSVFTNDELLKLSNNGKNLIEKNYAAFDTYPLKRIKSILHKCPNYNGTLPLTREILDNLSDDEIINLTQEMEEIYIKALHTHSVARMKGLIQKEFCFEENDMLIDEDLLDALDDEEILKLSSIAKEKIKSILVNKKRIQNSSKDKCIISRKIKGISMRDELLQKLGVRKKYIYCN